MEHVGGDDRPVPIIIERKKEPIGDIAYEAKYGQKDNNVESFNCGFVVLHDSVLNVKRLETQKKTSNVLKIWETGASVSLHLVVFYTILPDQSSLCCQTSNRDDLEAILQALRW